jgi:hypothetical protein
MEAMQPVMRRWAADAASKYSREVNAAPSDRLDLLILSLKRFNDSDMKKPHVAMRAEARGTHQRYTRIMDQPRYVLKKKPLGTHPRGPPVSRGIQGRFIV